MSLVVSIVVALGAAYAVLVLLAWALQDRLLYIPDRTLDADPGVVGLDHREVTFTTEDGVTLHGWLVPHPDARFTVLFCHGNAGDIADRLFTLQVLHDLGLSVLIFDYRGYGRSEGSPSESGLYDDARAAWRFLVEDEGLPPEHVVVWGRSLGGAVAADLARQVRVGGLVVESTFNRAIDVARRHYGWLPVGRLMRFRFDAAEAVAATDVPKLFLHSPDDEVIPYELGTRLYDAAAPPKRRVDLRGGHNDGFGSSLPTVRGAIGDFLGSLDRARG